MGRILCGMGARCMRNIWALVRMGGLIGCGRRSLRRSCGSVAAPIAGWLPSLIPRARRCACVQKYNSVCAHACVGVHNSDSVSKCWLLNAICARSLLTSHCEMPCSTTATRSLRPLCRPRPSPGADIRRGSSRRERVLRTAIPSPDLKRAANFRTNPSGEGGRRGFGWGSRDAVGVWVGKGGVTVSKLR